MDDFFDPLDPELIPLEEEDVGAVPPLSPFPDDSSLTRLERLKRWIRDIDL